MPKIKTHSGTKKRVKISKNGRVYRRHSARNHFLEKKTASTKRNHSGMIEIKGKNRTNIKKKLGV